jgi:transposase
MANATGRPVAPLALNSEERAYLERQVRRRRIARSSSEHCRIILRCAEGTPSKAVATVHEHTVGNWRRRFLKDRIEGLLDEARPGRPRTIDDDEIAAVIERTLRSTPADATHWSIRSMAAAVGFSHRTIRRIWTAFGLQPHRAQSGFIYRRPTGLPFRLRPTPVIRRSAMEWLRRAEGRPKPRP